MVIGALFSRSTIIIFDRALHKLSDITILRGLKTDDSIQYSSGRCGSVENILTKIMLLHVVK